MHFPQLAARRIHIRLVRLLLGWALLVMSYMMLGLPWRANSVVTASELVSFAVLVALFGGAAFSFVAIRRAPTATAWLLIAMACYGVVMLINLVRALTNIPSRDIPGAVVVSYALALSIGIALILAALLALPFPRRLPPAA